MTQTIRARSHAGDHGPVHWLKLIFMRLGVLPFLLIASA